MKGQVPLIINEEPKAMNALQDDNANRQKRLCLLGKIGWWEANFTTREYLCSEFISQLLGTGHIISFSDFAALIREDWRGRACQKFLSIEESDNYYEQEFPLCTPHGIVWVNSRMDSKKPNHKGELTAFGIIQEIPPRENKETLFKDIFDNIPAGVEIYNEEGVLIDVNKQDMEIFGVHHKRDMQGIDLLHNPNIGPERTRIIKENEESRFQFDYQFSLTDGYYPSSRNDSINLITKIRKMFDAKGKCMGYVMINLDNTANKERERELIAAKERAEKADKLKSAFIANMSHEIRTPLNAIIGFSSLMADTDNADERKMYQEIIDQNNTQLLKLISDVLDLAKIESGTFCIDKQPFDPIGLCTDVLISLKIKTHPDVNIHLADHLQECTLNSDRTRLNQVLTNLVNNAIKFTTHGSICIGYELVDKGMLRFYVTDTGIGIPQDKQAEIFNRFTKLNGFVQGSGLGLSICKSIIEALGGTIGVESEEGKGSTFWFTLPIT